MKRRDGYQFLSSCIKYKNMNKPRQRFGINSTGNKFRSD